MGAVYSRLRVLYRLLLAAGGILERPCREDAVPGKALELKPSVLALGKGLGSCSDVPGGDC